MKLFTELLFTTSQRIRNTYNFISTSSANLLLRSRVPRAYQFTANKNVPESFDNRYIRENESSWLASYGKAKGIVLSFLCSSRVVA